MQIAKGIGGLNFYDDNFESMTDGATPNLHWVDTDVTDSVYHPETKIIDINAKTGLYPLHAAMSLYYQYVQNNDDNRFDADSVYRGILENNIYAIAKTKMAKTITQRTLTGYRNYKTNVAYIENFSSILKSNIEEGKRQVEEAFEKVKFDVVIGNPPYQEVTTGRMMKKGQQQSVRNVFHEFQLVADQVARNYSCLIYPGGRWIQRSGKGMADFGLKQINSPHLLEIIYYQQASEVFKDVAISDGISVVVKDYHKKNDGFKFSFIENGLEEQVSLCAPGDKLLVLNPKNSRIVEKIEAFIENNELHLISNSEVLNRALFKIESDFAERNPDKVEIYTGQSLDYKNQIKLLTNDKSGKAGRATWFIADKDAIKVNSHLIDKWKVVVSSANAGGQKRDNQLEILDNHSAFGRSRIALKAFNTEQEAQNFYKYMKSYIIRFAFLMTDESLSSLGKYVPDLIDYSPENNIIDFEYDNIDKQLQQLMKISDFEMEYIKEYVDNFKK